MTVRRRALAKHTHDNWPCCGEPPESDYGRPKGEICQECRRLIDIGRATLERESAAGRKQYEWALRHYWWPEYYGPFDFEDEGTRRGLARAMYDLIESVIVRIEEHTWGKKVPKLLDCEGTRSRYDGTGLVSIDTTVRDRLNELDRRIRSALAETYRCGKTKGQNVLRQLAAGEVSLKDFDEELDRR